MWEIVAALRGKVALITGASRGIGRATTERLSNEAADVAVNYSKSREEADEAVRTIEERGEGASDSSRCCETRRYSTAVSRNGCQAEQA